MWTLKTEWQNICIATQCVLLFPENLRSCEYIRCAHTKLLG